MAENRSNINPYTGQPYGSGYAATLADQSVTNPARVREAEQGLLAAARKQQLNQFLAPALEAQRLERAAQERQSRLNREIQDAERAALRAGGPDMSALAAIDRMRAAREEILAKQRLAGRPAAAAPAMTEVPYGGPPPSVPMLSGETPAAYYMRSSQLERRPSAPTGIAAASVNEGGEVAASQNQDRRESSFLDTLLGNVDVAGLLQVFARPEFMQPGQSFAQGFSRAAAARTAAQQAQEATEAKAQREQEELDIARQRAEAAMLTAQRSGTTPRALGITGPKVDEFKAAITSEPAFVDAITKFSQKGTTWLSRRFGEGIDEEGIKSRVALDAIAIQQRTGATPSEAIQAAIDGLGGTPQKAETGGDPFANIGRR